MEIKSGFVTQSGNGRYEGKVDGEEIRRPALFRMRRKMILYFVRRVAVYFEATAGIRTCS
jgi:hypothetical protein